MSTQGIPEVFKGFGVDKPENWSSPKLVEYKPKPLRDTDVVLKVECCGICGSDIHTVRGDWGPLGRNDLVVGHEIVGNVTWVGKDVKNISVGQRVGVGAQSSCCTKCEQCINQNEQHCKNMVSTYNNQDPDADNYVTQGGYASYKVANEACVFPIPEGIESVHAAPLLCGGLTVFSPLIRTLGFDATGKTVGIIGIGGLGHMAIQFARALGAEVVAISRSSSKKEQTKQMGASGFIATGEEKDWSEKYSDKFDMLLNCATSFSSLDFTSLLSTLKPLGSLVSVGAPSVSETINLAPFSLLVKGIKVSGSLIGSKEEAIKMFEIAAAKGVKPWVEEVPLNEENCGKALTRCDEGDVRYRFVLTKFDEAFAN